MNRFFKPLDLGKFVFDDYRKEKSYSSPLSNISSEFKEFLKSKNLYLNHILVLWRPAGGGTMLHSDGQIFDPSWARLNFVHGGAGTMSWWEPDDPASITIPDTVGEYPSKIWPLETLSKSEEAVLFGWNIVNVGTPHGTVDIKSDRWVVSLDLTFEGKKTSFELLCGIFSTYGK